VTVVLGVLAIAWGTWLLWREDEGRHLPRLVALLDRLVTQLEERPDGPAEASATEAGGPSPGVAAFVQQVGELLDQGLTVPEIARRLERPLGEVELARGLWRARR
jgi:hypothetical protein